MGFSAARRSWSCKRSSGCRQRRRPAGKPARPSRSPREITGCACSRLTSVTLPAPSRSKRFLVFQQTPCWVSPGVCFRGAVVSSRDAAGTGSQAGLLLRDQAWGLQSDFPYGAAHPPPSATSGPGQLLLSCACTGNQEGLELPSGSTARFLPQRKTNPGLSLRPSVPSAGSGAARGAAARERSRGSVWLRQAAPTPLGASIPSSAEIAGWHWGTAQQEPRRSASEKHQD